MRRTPLARGRSRLPERSQRNVDRQPEREAARQTALARAGHRCQMAELIPEVRCGGRLEVDEIEGRGAHPGTQYDDTFQQVGCRAHHQWKTEHPKLAEERGLRRKSSFERRRNMAEE